ncbi:MAG: hypothetical protein KQH63_04390 [Desulfobulbaceae bacterium]|nr:hypothetical protein [Desulfobulbaceae bacterium]
MTIEEISEVIKATEVKDKKKRPLLGGNLTLFLLMIFDCGLRRKEAMLVRLENFDWDKRTLRITETKTGKRLFNILEKCKGEKGLILPKFHKDTVQNNYPALPGLCGIKMRLLDSRVPKRHAKTRTGHENERILDHYDHPKTDKIYEEDFDFMKKN